MNPVFPASIVACGLFLAAAAAPSGPDALPSEVAGVVGSGDQLALQLRQTADTPPRLVHLGDDAIDGWTLSGLTATAATLSKDGQTRTIGLNPSGALASKAPTVAPTLVTMAGEDARLLAQAIARGVWDGEKLQPGLTLEETQRFYVLNERFSETWKAFQTDLNARAEKAGIKLMGAIMRNDLLSALGPQYAPEYAALINKMDDERDRQYATAFETYGPVTLRVGSEAERQAAQAPYGTAAWTRSAPAADGSFQMTLTAPNANTGLRYSMDLAANPPPLDSIPVMADTFNMIPQPPR
ncbi:MAG: hypothetical protein JWM33_2842 [Caulobacteraceae bacterium]|nr:hypothetical protein [Caulobacteraceae bacterium]